MTGFKDLIEAMSASALDTLEGFDEQAALEAGLDPTKVRAWRQLHEIYLEPSTSPQKQRMALERVRRHGFSLDQLAMIERRLRPIKDRRERRKLRILLLDAAATYDGLAARARKLVPKKEKAARKQVTFSRSRAGRRTMHVTGDERDIADLEFALTRDLDPSKPAGPQMLAAFLRLIRGAGGPGGGGGVPYAVPRPMILIPLPEWVKILRGEGDETVLGLTDATTMTGAEFLNQVIAGGDYCLEAATFHPQAGPVNLYRVERFANQKQRDLVRATMPVCTVPDCRHGADSCELHHVTAWKHGGETNLGNLAPVCRYHNRTNDDDHSARPAGSPGNGRGHIEISRGVPVWVSPRGYRIPNPYHSRFGAMAALFD